jgi:HEAT repeat protein
MSKRAQAMIISLTMALSLSGIFPGQQPVSAAQASPSPLDGILKQLLTFDTGLRSEAYWKLRDFVRSRKDDPEARADCEMRLLAFLRSGATVPARMAVCRELRLIASEKAVPTLQSLLLDPALSDPARYALEEIQGPTVDKVFLTALDRATGTMKTGIIASLGARRMGEAVPALTKYLEGSAQEFVKAAAMSLGAIGGKDAAAVLAKAVSTLPGEFKSTAASALLDCAEDLLRANEATAAAGYYEKILAADLGPAFRGAALRGKIAASGDKAATLILETLKASDPVLHEAAIPKIRDVIPPGGIAPIAALLPSLPEESQVKLLAVLGGYPDEASLAAVIQATASSSAAVRIAALKAMSEAGKASNVPFLADRAASARGEEQSAARNALALLKGRPGDEAIIRALGETAPDNVKSELILAVGERRMFAAKSVLVKQFDSSSEPIRIQSVKTLKIIGTPSDIPALLDLLAKSGSDAEREEVENAAAALAQKIAQPEGRSNAVKAGLASAKDPGKRAGLIRVLGKIGDDSSLPLVRKGLKDADPGVADAAVRAITGWPNAVPIEEVWELAKTGGNETQKLLALRGFIRMAASAKFRRPDTVVAELKLAAETARRPEEKRLVLAALPDFATPEALALAQSLLRDPEVKAEAQAAVDRIKKRIADNR